MIVKTWNDFIEKIKVFRKAKGKSGLSAPTIVRLLYSGSFDDMLDEETMKIPAQERYLQLSQDVLKAMGSKAALPKASGEEQVGINKITSVPHLLLWRHSTNPFARYDITSFCKGFLLHAGFVRAQKNASGISWFRPVSHENQTQVDICPSWSGLFDSNNAYKTYTGDRLLGVMGVIVKVEKKMYQGNKESLSVTIFNGSEYIEGVRVWPEKSGKIKQELVAGLEKHAVGLVIIRPKPWNDKAGGSIVGWTKVKGL